MASQNKLVLKSEYIKKPHQVIQIEGKLNLLQHKCWNILALNAFKKGIKDGQRNYEISLTEIYKHLGYKAENDKHLKEALVAIMHIVIQGNIIEDGEDVWHAFVLLGHCYVKKGVCHYEYTTPVINLLSNPKQYVKLLMKMQNKFKSGYSLKLYEFLKTRYIEKQGRGTTGELTIEVFRSLMGIKENDYPQFKDFNKRVVKTAIDEINEKTDIFVELELIKDRQKVKALKFQISENPNKKANLQGLDLESLEEEMDLNQSNSEKSENQKSQNPPPTNPVIKPNSTLKPKLEKLGFGENQINKFLEEIDQEKIQNCTDYVAFKLQKEIETNKTKNRIESPTGYFFTIYNAYEDIDFSSLVDWRKAEEIKQEAEIKWQEEQQRQQEEEELKKAQTSKQRILILEYILSNPDEVNEICEEFLEELKVKSKFMHEQMLKEAKRKLKTPEEIVRISVFTKSSVEAKIWKKIDPKALKS